MGSDAAWSKPLTRRRRGRVQGATRSSGRG